ncbi:MAG: hypothetical protein ACOYJ7_05375 [Rhodoluna sp.]|nr:hypothetical protein [Micrococcales bacterium]NDE69169.1 hypothetical protein [Microbacteriaceae bacterium]
MTESNYQPLTREALAQQAAEIARRQAQERGEVIEEQEVEEETIDSTVEVDEEGNPQFNIPNALAGEFTGSQLLVEIPPDITASGAIITELGEVVVTASIDVSSLITATGEITPVIVEETEADLDKDASANYIPGIPPLRASGVIAKTSNQQGIPGGVHKGPSPYVIATIIGGTAGVFGILVALGFFFGII